MLYTYLDYNKHIHIVDYIPIQTDPDFTNPISQLHRYDPCVFTHDELAGQGDVFVSVHSLASIEQSFPRQPGLHMHIPSSGLQVCVFSRSHVQVSSQLAP